MKITEQTKLKQGDKVFSAVESEDANNSGFVYWLHGEGAEAFIMAQSSPILEGVPVISTDVDAEALLYQTVSDVLNIHVEPVSNLGVNVEVTMQEILNIIEGYNIAHQPDKKWTDEDMKIAIEFGVNLESGNIKWDAEKYPNPNDQLLALLEPTASEITVDDQWRTIKVVTTPNSNNS